MNYKELQNKWLETHQVTKVKNYVPPQRKPRSVAYRKSKNNGQKAVHIGIKQIYNAGVK